MDSAAGVKLALLKDRIGILEALGIFAAASRPVLERLAGATVEQDVPDGTTVIVEGDVADALYVLISGTADVVAATPDGGQRSIYNLLPGEYFGEIGLLQGIARTASVITTSACHLYRIDGGDFTDCLTQAAPSGSFLEAARSRLSVTQPARAFSSTAVPRPS
jgi:CRP-like cAMP-binding protein